jgi:hypothetical protein
VSLMMRRSRPPVKRSVTSSVSSRAYERCPDVADADCQRLSLLLVRVLAHTMCTPRRAPPLCRAMTRVACHFRTVARAGSSSSSVPPARPSAARTRNAGTSDSTPASRAAIPAAPLRGLPASSIGTIRASPTLEPPL